MARKRKTRRARGFGSVYEKRPGEWVVAWINEAGRRRVSKPFPTQALAEKVREKKANDKLMGRAGVAPELKNLPTFGQLGDDWIKRHESVFRSHADDAGRWRNHVRPAFGHLKVPQIDNAAIRAFVEEKHRNGPGHLDGGTIGHCVKLISRIYGDLVERPIETGATVNPVRLLSKTVRRMCKSTHDARATPFIESLEEVQKLIAALEPPFDRMYAVGVFGVLRTGEVLGLFAEDVDVAARRIHLQRQVQFGKVGPLKDGAPRTIPILDAAHAFLAEQRLKVGRSGPLFPALRKYGGGRKRRPSRFISIHTLHDRFKEACVKIGREDILGWEMPWYQATRHTGASLWVAHGGNIATLALIMGHSTTWVTERYAHLRPDLYSAADLGRLSLSGAVSSHYATNADLTEAEKSNNPQSEP